MLGRFLNKSLHLSLKNNNAITRFSNIYLQTQQGSSVRLFTATSQLKTTEVVSSNGTDTSSNLSFLRTNPIKVEDSREERIFYISFREDIDEFSKKGQWRSILKLCEKVKKSNRKPNLFIYNTILHAYIPLGSVENSFKILEDMKLANVNPNLTTYNYLLRTYAQTPSNQQNPYLRERILEMITEGGLQPDIKTYECYIESILAGEEYERAFGIFDSLKSKNIYPQLELYISMIRKAISINEPSVALNCLKNLEKNQLIYVPTSLYNDVLRICAYEYYADGILYCWDKLQHRGLNLDEGACVDILYFAGNQGNPDLSIKVIEYLIGVRKLKLQKLHFIPLIQAYVKRNDIKNAMESLNIMRQAGFQVSLFDATSSGIFTLIKKNEETIDKAYYCLEELHSEGKKIDVVALNVIISACGRIGKNKDKKRKIDVIRALETYKAAEKLDIKPNTETFNSLLLLCYYTKQKDLAEQLWKEMLELKVNPSVLTYGRIIQTICTQSDYEEAFIYLEEMKSKNLLPSREVYESIITNCVLYGDTRAILALEEMKSFDYEVSQPLYNKLKAAGFDVNLVGNKFNQQKAEKISRKDNSVKTSTSAEDSDVMDRFVDMISSKVNENEQKDKLEL